MNRRSDEGRVLPFCAHYGLLVKANTCSPSIEDMNFLRLVGYSLLQRIIIWAIRTTFWTRLVEKYALLKLMMDTLFIDLDLNLVA